MNAEEAIKIVKSKKEQSLPRTHCGRSQEEKQRDLLDEVLVAEIERLRNIVVTTLFYRNEDDIMFDCPRCSHPHKLSDTDLTQWCCDECGVTLHYSDTTFLEILAQVQKRYAFK